MPHHHLNTPALCAVLAGCFISCAALVFATTPANAQPFNPAPGPDQSAVGLADDANRNIVLAELTPSALRETASISRSASDAGLPDAGVFADGSGRSFVLDTPMAQALPLSGAAAAPAARSLQDFSTEVVGYTLLGDALRDSGLTGFAGTGGRKRVESDWRRAADTLFAGANIQSPSVEQNVAARSYGFYGNPVVYGATKSDLSTLYYRSLTERLNLTVRSYVGYEDASPGNSDPIPYTGIGLTLSREAWPK